MNEQRFVVSDILWERLEPHLPGKVSDAGVTAKDNRLFLEAVFWRVRTGSPWRDLPPAFGHWNSQFRRFRRWAKAGVFESLFKAMSGDPDLEYALVPSRQIAVQSPAGQWTVPSFRFTRRQPAQKGGSNSSHRTLARRVDDQDRGVSGCARQSGALPAAAGTSP